jgi:hypothetical protein
MLEFRLDFKGELAEVLTAIDLGGSPNVDQRQVTCYLTRAPAPRWLASESYMPLTPSHSKLDSLDSWRLYSEVIVG